MKIVLFSDSHFKNSVSSIYKTLFKDLIDRVISLKPSFLVIIGDLLDSSSLSPDLYKFLVEVLKPLSERGTEIIILTGDHELPAAHKENPLVFFKYIPGFRVILKPERMNLGDLNCLFLPPFSSASDLTDCDVVFYHGFLKNAEVTSGYRIYSKENFSVVDFNKTGARYLFFGGIHKRQSLDSEDFKIAQYLGSLWQLSFGEEGNSTGYAVFDSDTGELKFFSLPSPRFKNVRFQGGLLEVIKKFENLELPSGKWNLKLFLDPGFSNEDLLILRKIGQKKELVSLHFETVTLKRKLQPKKKVNLSLTDSPVKVLDFWLKEKGLSERKREILTARAVQLLKNLSFSCLQGSMRKRGDTQEASG